MKKLYPVLLAAVSAMSLAAAEVLTFAPKDAMPVYKCGEKAAFTLSVFDEGKAVTSGTYTIVYTLDGNKELSRQTVDLAKGNPATVSTTLNQPGFVLARVLKADGKPAMTPAGKGKKAAALAGAAFDPEKIKMGYDLPEDFMAFWEAGRKQLADKPVKLEKVEKYSKQNYTTYYVTVNTLNNETLTGYLSIPKGKGPFPAYITVPGAGPGIVGPALWASKGVITLSMNVHKFPTADNAAEQKARYAENQQIKPHYPARGAGDRDKYFFRSVYVGIDRVINHVAAMPEWDKKHMVIDGSSQGGGSSLILTGFNKNITALAANVPALCDHGGAKTGRSSGWPRLNNQKNPDAFAPYFDAANFARFIKVPALLSCGFIDTTCSPASVYAAYNQLKGEKQMVHVPLEGHTVSKIYGKVRNDFVAKHLGLNK